MKKTELLQHLAAKFFGDIAVLRHKKDDAEKLQKRLENLDAELERLKTEITVIEATLRQRHGNDLIDQYIGQATAAVAKQPASVEAKPEKKRRRKARGCNMSMMDAAKAAIPCIVELGKNNSHFTSVDVGKALANSGNKVPVSWPSLILSKFLTGVKAVDKSKKPFGYILVGTLGLKTLAETKVKAKGRRKKRRKTRKTVKK